MSEEAVAKRRGRPALDPSEKKRRNVTFRLRDSFREEIERRAVANGRSMSEEIETILERFVPLADVITKEFVQSVRNLMEQHKADVQNRTTVGEMTRWNALVFRKIAQDMRDQSEAIEKRTEIYSKIENMLIRVGVNETDRMAIMGGLQQDLNSSIELLNQSSRIPELPIVPDDFPKEAEQPKS